MEDAIADCKFCKKQFNAEEFKKLRHIGTVDFAYNVRVDHRECCGSTLCAWVRGGYYVTSDREQEDVLDYVDNLDANNGERIVI